MWPTLAIHGLSYRSQKKVSLLERGCSSPFTRCCHSCKFIHCKVMHLENVSYAQLGLLDHPSSAGFRRLWCCLLEHETHSSCSSRKWEEALLHFHLANCWCFVTAVIKCDEKVTVHPCTHWEIIFGDSGTKRGGWVAMRAILLLVITVSTLPSHASVKCREVQTLSTKPTFMIQQTMQEKYYQKTTDCRFWPKLGRLLLLLR